MISEHLGKVKYWLEANKNDLYVAAIIFLVGMASFGLGRLSILWPKKEPITVTGNQESGIRNQGEDIVSRAADKSLDSKLLLHDSLGKYVASKSGKYYHFPWCAGALKISDQNKIWFQTKEEAESRGLKPAGNCQGL